MFILISNLPLHWGLLLKERICSLGEQILSFKSNPQIRSDTVNTFKAKNKNDFFYLSEGMENCKMSGKSQGILKWMISGHPELRCMEHLK